MHIKKWCPSYCFGLQIISTVFSLWSRWIVFLLYVWGDVVSSRCCCWVVGRYTGIPYIDSCPLPARHGCVLVVPARPGFPEMVYKSAMKKRAGQPARVSSSAPWPRTGALKRSKWSPHPPLAQSAERVHTGPSSHLVLRREAKGTDSTHTPPAC